MISGGGYFCVFGFLIFLVSILGIFFPSRIYSQEMMETLASWGTTRRFQIHSAVNGALTAFYLCPIPFLPEAFLRDNQILYIAVLVLLGISYACCNMNNLGTLFPFLLHHKK